MYNGIASCEPPNARHSSPHCPFRHLPIRPSGRFGPCRLPQTFYKRPFGPSLKFVAVKFGPFLCAPKSYANINLGQISIALAKAPVSDGARDAQSYNNGPVSLGQTRLSMPIPWGQTKSGLAFAL